MLIVGRRYMISVAIVEHYIMTQLNLHEKKKNMKFFFIIVCFRLVSSWSSSKQLVIYQKSKTASLKLTICEYCLKFLIKAALYNIAN